MKNILILSCLFVGLFANDKETKELSGSIKKEKINEIKEVILITNLLKSSKIEEKEKALELIKDEKIKNKKELLLLKADLLYNGLYGVKKNKYLSLKYYRKSAELKNDEALYKLAMFYYYGVFVEYNLMKSVEYLTKSANLGHEKAKETLKILSYNPNIEIEKEEK